MNIGVNTRVLLSSRMEGVCRYIHEVLKKLVLSHPEDQFYFFFDRPFDQQFIYADNVTPVVLSPQARHPILWYLWFEQAIPRALKKYNIDVFYSGDTYMSLSSKVPTVLVCHDIAYAHYPDHIPLLTRKYYQHYFPKFHERADKILAVSEFTRNDIIEKYKLDESKVLVAHNSVKEGLHPISIEEQIAIKATYTKGVDYFLYVGAVHPRKNVTQIIHAFDSFKTKTGSDKKLILVARLAWNAEAFKATLASAKYKNDIVHLSEIYTDEVNRITASAYAMVYISLFEGFGLPILEAMHSNVPVICSNISSMPEVSEEAALQVDPHDLSAVANAMEKLDTDKSLRASLIEKGKVQRQKFSWDKTAAITYQALKDAVSKKEN